ncbi:MAG: type IV secretory system conjugative DNA transfer family protein [Planctomycetales bacterium]|nr:type IV secretory system conjugative DNA transfer family protein [Planctomycetales bacterium]
MNTHPVALWLHSLFVKYFYVYLPPEGREFFDNWSPDSIVICTACTLCLALLLPTVFIKATFPPPKKRQEAIVAGGLFLQQFNLDLPKVTTHVMLIGQSGSGKSSWIKRAAPELLSNRMCGCVLAAVKPSEINSFLHAVKKAGRTDYKILKPGKSKFNPLAYELFDRKGGSPESFASLLERCDMLMATASDKGSESFWRKAQTETAVHAIGAAKIAFGRAVTLKDVYDVAANVPASPELVGRKLDSWRQNRCRAILEMAQKNAVTEQEKRRVNDAIEYLTVRLPQAGSKVIGATSMSLSGLIAPLIRGQLYDTVVTETSDITPDDALNGQLVGLDCPVLESKGNHLLHALFMLQSQEACLAREITKTTPYVLIFVDEYQLIASPEFDSEAITVFRSQRVGKITAVQSLSVLQNAMDDGIRAKQQANALVGNHATHVYFQNTDEETGEFFSKLCGKQIRTLTGGGQSASENPSVLKGNFSMNFHQTLMERKLPSALSRLRGGGTPDFTVTCYLHQTGTKFENGLPFTKRSFTQDLS